MIVERRFVDFMNSLEREEHPYLTELEAYALDTDVLIIRKEMQSFQHLRYHRSPLKVCRGQGF